MFENNIIAIRKENVTAADSAFADLMRKTEFCLNENAKRSVLEYKNLTAAQLESVSLAAIQQSCEGTPFRYDEIKLISGLKFPDIIAETYYGVEVKSTNERWVEEVSRELSGKGIEGSIKDLLEKVTTVG